MKSFWFVLVAALATGCYSAGPYGYSRTYTPLDEEEDATKGAKEYDPVMAQRSPDEWKNKKLSVFGIVKTRNPGPGGASDLTISIRTLEPRNLCDTGDEDTCRVTVSEREHAVLHALVKLTDEDDIGNVSVGAGSLIRVVGTLSDSVDSNDGTVVLRATYYRHWPRNFYVTTADRTHMRR